MLSPRWASFPQAKCHVVANTQGYHLVCIWSSLVKFQGGGVVLKSMLCAGLWICWIFVPGLIPVFHSSVSLSNWEEGLCLAGCHVVAQTQGYHLVCIWSGLFKFQGGGDVLKFGCFRSVMQFFVLFICKQWPTLLLMFQVTKQLNWWLKDLVLLSNVGLGCLEWLCNRWSQH